MAVINGEEIAIVMEEENILHTRSKSLLFFTLDAGPIAYACPLLLPQPEAWQ